MTSPRTTTQDDAIGRRSRHTAWKAPTPGLVLVFSVESPRCDVLPLQNGQLTLGRGEVSGVALDDLQMSRRHVRVRREGRRWVKERWRAARALGVHRTQLRRWIARRESRSDPEAEP